ncbi:MAG: hypothetical protein ACRCVU_03375 [Flavobacterium sp.]
MDKINGGHKKYNNKPILLDKESDVFYESPYIASKYGVWFNVNNITAKNAIKYSFYTARFYMVTNPDNEKYTKLVLQELYGSLDGYHPNDTLDVVFKEYPSTVLRSFEKMYIRPMKKKLN